MCHNCGSMGHIARSCTRKGKGKGGGGGKDVRTNDGGHGKAAEAVLRCRGRPCDHAATFGLANSRSASDSVHRQSWWKFQFATETGTLLQGVAAMREVCRILRHFSHSVRMDVSAHFSALDDEEFFLVEGSGWRERRGSKMESGLAFYQSTPWRLALPRLSKQPPPPISAPLMTKIKPRRSCTFSKRLRQQTKLGSKPLEDCRGQASQTRPSHPSDIPAPPLKMKTVMIWTSHTPEESAQCAAGPNAPFAAN